ncbi:MAG: glycosyltransferase [Acidimicrobiales bacterium]|jgi:trehalose synthase
MLAIWQDEVLPFRDLLSREYPVHEVFVPSRALAKLEPLIGIERYRDLISIAGATREKLEGRAVWNISSTAEGGGVAEMLQVLVGYTLDAGFDVHWLVISGDAEFFAITKRIHNHLHGAAGDGGELGANEMAHYMKVTDANAQSVINLIRPGDVVLLHDPQTAGLATALASAGAHVVWRCHVGHEQSNEWTEQAWSFLQHHLTACNAYIFSMRAYVPSWMEESTVWIIPPSIDPFSPKNEELDRQGVLRTLRHIGLLTEVQGDAPASFIRRDGTRGLVERKASIVCTDTTPFDSGVPLVVQVSRWDRLKDMAGVMEGFAACVTGRIDAQLALVGPSTNEVSDDPEESAEFQACLSAWNALPIEERRHICLVTLPMEDTDENAAMVNAIQRYATVIVQKSLAEGFGLTVTEAMWKSKAVIASGVGGIAIQIVPGTGILLENAADLSAFGRTLIDLLAHPDVIADLGRRAHQRVLDSFVGDEHLKRLAYLLDWLS